MSLSPARHVFVYGTLRRGEQRDINLLQPAPEWVGQASLPGVLYDLGAYPGILLGGDGLVHGEVYRISPALELQLDEIEEVWPQQTGEYARREAEVRLDPQRPPGAGIEPDAVTCLVYEIASRRTQGKPVIGCGDWVQYRLSRGS
ncbi:gamma-glutamylcyclotransferase family protein [Polaromonas sp.]|uniref:gamma-glutamylcyclotransferase family protein n=1 Tax=Polaromonas sp. TaxID=1869339 RepID=UPI003353427F